MKFNIYLFFLLLVNICYSQLSDLHFLPPLAQVDDGSIDSQVIYISTPETNPFSVSIYRGNSNVPLTTILVSNAIPRTYNLPAGSNDITLLRDINIGVAFNNGGLRIQSVNGEKFFVNYRGANGSQATSLTSKGRQALGTKFKWGGVPNYDFSTTGSSVLGIMATEDNTIVNIFDYDSDCVFRLGNNPTGITDDSLQITLQRGESYVLQARPDLETANIDGWIGATIESSKNIVISNGGMNYTVSTNITNGKDAGIDQPVPEKNLGKDYIFIRGAGLDETEFVNIIAIEDNTNIYVNGSATPIATIDNGEYYIVNGSNYPGFGSGSNMYVRTSKDVYAYQNIAGAQHQKTIGLNFVAPVNCLIPTAVDNIPNIQDAAGVNMNGGVTIIASSITPDGNIIVRDDTGIRSKPARRNVLGNSEWVTYYIPDLIGNVSVNSTGPVAVGFFGNNGNRGMAGYFSGFDIVPTVDLEVAGSACIPGTILNVIDDTFDAYQWFYEGEAISEATLSSYNAEKIGEYYVRVTRGACSYNSDELNVYYCDPDLSLNKTVADQKAIENDNVVFNIIAENTSNNLITNIVVTDLIPIELELLSVETSSGTWAAPDWTIASLNPGERETLQLTTIVKSNTSPHLSASSVTNTVTKTQDQVDQNISPDNPSARVIIYRDFDGDGILDTDDLDDDNDGILDTFECSGTVEDLSQNLGSGKGVIGTLDPVWNVEWLSNIDELIYAPGNDGYIQEATISGDFNSSSYITSNSSNDWITYDFRNLPNGNTTNDIGNHSDADSDGIINEQVIVGETGDNVRLVYKAAIIIPDDALVESISGNLQYAIDGELLNIYVNRVNGSNTSLPNVGFNAFSSTTLDNGWILGENIIEIEIGSADGITALLVEELTLSYKTCPDLDGDLLNNVYDRDSDNDSCPDAMEGESLIPEESLNPDSSIKSPININTGIPQMAGSGQNDISAYDSAVLAEGCKTDPIIVPTPTVINFLCTSGNNRDNAQISIDLEAINGGSGIYSSIQLIDSDDNIQSSSTGKFNINNIEGDTFSIKVTDNEGNTGSVFATIAEFDIFENTTMLVNKKISCNNLGEDINIRATGSLTNNIANPDNYEYRQSTTTLFQDDSEFINLQPASYTFQIRNKTTGCVREITHTVIDPNTFNIVIEKLSDVTCSEDEGTITLGITDDTYTEGFIWAIFDSKNTIDNRSDDGEAIQSGVGSANTNIPAIALKAGSYIAEVTLSEEPLCTKTIVFSIDEFSNKINPNLSQVALVNCDNLGGSILVEPEGGNSPYNLVLTNSSTKTTYTELNVATNRFKDLQSGSYDISITDALGCTILFKDEITLTKPDANLNAQLEVIYECNNNVLENKIQVSLEDRSERLYVLYALDSQDPSKFRLKPDFENISTGNHYLTIAHDNGCINTIPFEVMSFDNLSVSAEQRNINQITAVVTGGQVPYTYSFNNRYNGTDNTFFIQQTGIYDVVVRDANGCEVSTPIFMDFIDVTFPNFFTPDGDGFNDFWLPLNISQYPNIFLKVYDRYGRYVYEYQDNKNGWDGIYLDTSLPTGDYWYVVKLNEEADDRQFIGHFTLYR